MRTLTLTLATTLGLVASLLGMGCDPPEIEPLPHHAPECVPPAEGAACEAPRSILAATERLRATPCREGYQHALFPRGTGVSAVCHDGDRALGDSYPIGSFDTGLPAFFVEGGALIECEDGRVTSIARYVNRDGAIQLDDGAACEGCSAECIQRQPRANSVQIVTAPMVVEPGRRVEATFDEVVGYDAIGVEAIANSNGIVVTLCPSAVAVVGELAGAVAEVEYNPDPRAAFDGNDPGWGLAPPAPIPAGALRVTVGGRGGAVGALEVTVATSC
ncbi:MAG: hypothetical protein R3F65_23615 [bacterium]